MKVPLRTYLREIEEAIDDGQFDEAVAHCRHILETYPKHIATYRLMGKATWKANAMETRRIYSNVSFPPSRMTLLPTSG